MQFSHYRSELQKMIAKRDGYAVISVAALTLCLFLVVMMLWSLGREKIILVPPTLEKSFWVASSNVSAEYLSEMSAFFAYLRLNLTADNVTQQHATLLQYTDPSFYNTLKGQLLQEATHLNESHLSSAFFPVKLNVDAPHLKVLITGDLHGRVGDSLLPTQRVTYAIQFRFDGGRLWVKAFDEVTAND
jgi:conjugal transfer pilus assembly protein TraE